MMLLKLIVVILSFISIGLWITSKYEKVNEAPFFSFKSLKAFGRYIVVANVGFILMLIVLVLSGVGGNWDNDHAPNPNDKPSTPKQEYSAEMKADKEKIQQEITDLKDNCNNEYEYDNDGYDKCMAEIDGQIKEDFAFEIENFPGILDK